MHKYKVLFAAAVLAAISIILQIWKISYSYGGIIDIDVVGVPWLVGTFILGLSGGLLTSFVSALGIAIFAPTGIVGAIMKLAATIVLVLIVGIIGKKFGFGKKPMAIAFVLCLIARPAIMVLFNYYWAIPVFFNIPTEIALQKFPVELFVVPNIILAAMDFWIAYFLVFSTRLKARLDD
jgi:riboflavin transporter FmnP